MSVLVAGAGAHSGLPVFCRRRPAADPIQFSTTASLHGINMFSKCHDVSILNTHVPNGALVWKEHCKSITLVGVATGGLECDLPLLLSVVYDILIFCVGRKDLENFKNPDQIKRDLRSCYPLLDSLIESLDPSSVSGMQPTLMLDLMECVLCPEAPQLQQVLDQYAENVSGRWACLTIHGRLAATSSDWIQLDPREARILQLLLVTQAGAPLRDTPVYLPYTSPNVAFRAVTCKLLADVYVLVICGPTPSLAQVDEIVLRCWESYAQVIKDAKRTHPRNFPQSIHFESGVLGVLIVNIPSKKCVCSRSLHQSGQQKSRALSGAHRLDILRTFYVRAARDIVPELAVTKDVTDGEEELSGAICETYWCSEYHKCHAQRLADYLCCVLYASTIPTHNMRIITTQILNNFSSSKEIHW